MNKNEEYREFTVKYDHHQVVAYTDPTYVLRIGTKNDKIYIEMDSTSTCELRMELYPELLAKIIQHLQPLDLEQ
ncbi:hypothetical protein [Paenibacillus woosongensis]|uniref:Uncharacterized protein n=1 Tax=Paenibacillus woosongensis TaxID=307580 RepID=A0A7X2Z3R4_9BACL|nr:hypothetical protein [Paenibacillus woosongensis]MUG47056.1 hypothetical protein [Paenibacillus woosongensis]